MRWRSPCFWRARHEINGNRYQMFSAYRLSTSHVVEGSAARISCASRTDRTNTGSTLFGTRTVATEIWIQWHYIHVWIWNSIYVHVCLFVMLVHVLQILNLLFLYNLHAHCTSSLVCSKISVHAALSRLRIFCWAPFKYLDGSAVQHVTLLPWMSIGGEDSSKDATEIRLKHNIMHRECKRWWRNKSIAM